MKKRLLSATLALAMVLTMLPLTAFAADAPPDFPSFSTPGGDSGVPPTDGDEDKSPTETPDEAETETPAPVESPAATETSVPAQSAAPTPANSPAPSKAPDAAPAQQSPSGVSTYTSTITDETNGPHITSGKDKVTYVAMGNKIGTFQVDESGWYYSWTEKDASNRNVTKYGQVTAGAVVMSSNSSSGTYYSSLSAAVNAIMTTNNAGGTYIKVVGSSTDLAGGTTTLTKNITIDVFGIENVGLGTFNVPEKVGTTNNSATSLTITDSNPNRAKDKTPVSLAGITVGKNNFTVNLSNVNVSSGSITTNYPGSGAVNLSHKVNLTNAGCTGSIEIKGTSGPGTNCSGGEVSLKSGSSVGGHIRIETTAAGATASGGKITVEGGSNVTSSVIIHHEGASTTGGDITVKGNSLSDLSTTGGIYIENVGQNVQTGGTVNLDLAQVNSVQILNQKGGDAKLVAKNSTIANGSTPGTVKMMGYNTSIDSTSSNLGNVSIFGSTDSANSKKNPPKVDMKGSSTAESIKLLDTTTIPNLAPNKETIEKPYSIIITGSSEVTNDITLDYADIDITSSKTGKIELGGGTLDLMGDRTSTGDIELGGGTTGASTTATVADSATNVTTGSIYRKSGTTDTVIVKIPATSSNSYYALGGWLSTGTIVKGGSFAEPVPEEKYFPRQMGYWVSATGGYNGNYTHTYFTADPESVNDMVAFYQKFPDDKKPLVRLFGQSSSSITGSAKKGVFTLVDGKKVGSDEPNVVLQIEFTGEAGFVLPSMVNGRSVNTWTNSNDNSIQIAGGKEYGTANGDDVTYDPTLTWNDDGSSSSGSSSGGNTNEDYWKQSKFIFDAKSYSYDVTKLMNVTVLLTNNNLDAKMVRATLEGNTIRLTGVIADEARGFVNIPIELTTDNGTLVDALVTYNIATGSAVFDSVTPKVLDLVDSNTAVMVIGSGNRYTLSANLTPVATGLNVDSAETAGIVTTVPSNLNGSTKEYNEEMARQMTTGGGIQGSFNFSQSPALMGAWGAAVASVNANSIAGWIKSAQTTAWKSDKSNTGSPGQRELDATGYNQVWIVPYMAVNVSKYVRTGALTATFTPSYRIEVHYSGSGPAQYNEGRPIVVQTGRAMATPTGAFGTVDVNMPMPSDFDIINTKNVWIHQNDTYVTYAEHKAVSGRTQPTLNFDIRNVGSSFGTFVINNVYPTVALRNPNPRLGDTSESYKGPWDLPGGTPSGTGKTTIPDGYFDFKGNVASADYYEYYYDSLQAAVDQSTDRGAIAVHPSYTGSKSITFNGEPRTIYIAGLGNNDLTITNTSGVVQNWIPDGQFYQIQLTRSSVVVDEKEGDIPVNVAVAANGSAVVSKSRANEGDTITITLRPSVGYAASGVTVRTDTGAVVGVTGSNNSYRFVVPTGAKSITVTPSFVVAANTSGVTVSVNNTAQGTAVTSAGNNKVDPGTSVTVTVTPTVGQRTMGLTVTSDAGSVTPTRVGQNLYTFTVPASARNSVVVTPTFDVDNGTVFEDVWSTEYFSSAVAWAVGRNVTNGTSTYSFSPYNVCTRADMVTFLWRAAGSPTPTGVSNPFWDVQAGSYYYDAVLWAVSKGITNGVSSTQFGVNQNVTRAQAVTFLYRYEGQPSASNNSGFYDVPAGEYYARAVSWANSKGVTNGTTATSFSPNQSVTRAQAVTFLYRDISGNRA